METRAVLAAVYMGGRASLANALTHLYEEGAEKTFCGRIPADHLCDLKLDAPPSCMLCRKKQEKAAMDAKEGAWFQEGKA